LGDRFFKYKQDVNTLRSTLEGHFSRVINQIEAGLPDVKEEEGIKEDDVFSSSPTWTCPTCTVVNQMTNEQCQICRTKRPPIKSIRWSSYRVYH